MVNKKSLFVVLSVIIVAILLVTLIFTIKPLISKWFANTSQNEPSNKTETSTVSSVEEASSQSEIVNSFLESNISSDNNSSDIGTFSFSDFEWEIENFPSDKNVGEVNTGEVAIHKAKELWLEKYSTIAGEPYDPLADIETIKVYFNEENDAWLVRSILLPKFDGVSPAAIIEKSGKVIAVFMY